MTYFINTFLILYISTVFLISLKKLGFKDLPCYVSLGFTHWYCRRLYCRLNSSMSFNEFVDQFMERYKWIVLVWLTESTLYGTIIVTMLIQSISSTLFWVLVNRKDRTFWGGGRLVRNISSRTQFTGPFKAWVYQASKVSQLFKFQYNDMISRNGGRPMFKPLILMLKTLGFHLRSSMIRMIFVYLRQVSVLVRSQGIRGTSVHLKACHIQLMHALAGYKPKVSPSPVRVSVTGVGLPRFIPSVHRKRILAGDIRIMRLWLSLFSLFRVLEYPGKVKLSTITSDSPFSSRSERERNSLISYLGKWEINSFFWLDFLKMPFSHYWKHGFSCHDFSEDILEDIRAFPISKSGPFTNDRTVNTSPDSLYQAAAAFYSPLGRNLLEALEIYVGNKDNNRRFLVYLLKYSHLAVNKFTRSQVPKAHLFLPKSSKEDPTYKVNDQVIFDRELSLDISRYLDDFHYPLELAPLGKLGFKQEPAGKVRVFAMVDAWTQWALRPLHRKLFELLRPIPMDSTFDQMKAVERATKVTNRRFYSFDLSAATDRLPIQLQVRILSGFFGTHRARAWAELLVGRLYFIGKLAFGYMFPYSPQVERFLKYKVGQPMGALSSWAMLAITHHYIIQFVWWSLGHRTPFKDYAVLGDDIIIWNKKVAQNYLRVMDLLGVEVNLSKSIISNHSFEFAKRFVHKGNDISPLSLKEVNGVGENLLSLTSLGKKWNIDFPAMLSYLGVGFKTLGSFRNRSIRAATPKLRVALLYWMRDRVRPMVWFTLYSSQRQYVLSDRDQLSLAEAATLLYKDVIMDTIDRKRKNLEQLIKKYGDNPLVHQTWYPLAYEWLTDLDKVINWFNALSRLPRWIESGVHYSKGIENFLEELRLMLSFACSCPDFTSTVLRKKDNESLKGKETLLKEVFCQEVAIWMSMNSLIAGRGFPLSKIEQFIDETPEVHSTPMTKKEILLDILSNLRSYKIVRIFWKKVSVPIVYLGPRIPWMKPKPPKEVKFLPGGFFDPSYPYRDWFTWLFGPRVIIKEVDKSSLDGERLAVAKTTVEVDKTSYHKKTRRAKMLDKSLNALNKDVKGGADRAQLPTKSVGQLTGLVDDSGHLRPLPDQYFHPLNRKRRSLLFELAYEVLYTPFFLGRRVIEVAAGLIRKILLALFHSFWNKRSNDITRQKSFTLFVPYFGLETILEWIKAGIAFLILLVLLYELDPLMVGTPSPLKPVTEMISQGSYTVLETIQHLETPVKSTSDFLSQVLGLLGFILFCLLFGYSLSWVLNNGLDSLTWKVFRTETIENQDVSSLGELPYQRLVDPLDEPSWWPQAMNLRSLWEATKTARRVRRPLSDLSGETHRDWWDLPLDWTPTDWHLMTDSTYIETPELYHELGIFDTDTMYHSTWWSNLDIPGIILLGNWPEMGDTGSLIYN